MKITISYPDVNSRVVLDVSVNGKAYGELEPGKTITVTGPQIALCHGRLVEDEDDEKELA
jgi:hypothetical protein